MTTLQMAQRQGASPVPAGGGTGLAGLRAALWAPRFLGEPQAMLHVPLLFWLAEALRPARALVLGADDGSLFFALAQAMERPDRLEGRSSLRGLGFWPPEGGPQGKHPARVPARLRTHLRQLYPDLAELQPTTASDWGLLLQAVPAGSLDLLLIDLTRLPDEADLVPGPEAPDWRRLLEAQGLLLVHGSAQNPRLAEELSADADGWIELPLGAGLRLVPRGEVPPALAPLWASAAHGQIRGELGRLFHRLGQGHEAAARQAASEAAASASRTALAAATRELAELHKAHAQRSLILGRTQAELFHLRDTEDQLAHVRQEVARLQAEVEQAAADAKATEAALAAEVEELRRAQAAYDAERARLQAEGEAQARRLAELDSQLQTAQAGAATEREARFHETAALTSELEKQRQTQAALDKERTQLHAGRKELTGKVAELETRLRGAQAEVTRLTAWIDELLASTSWRLTAPLRWVKTRLSR